MSEKAANPPANLKVVGSVGLILAVVGLAATFAGGLSQVAMQSYVYGWALWLSMCLGCLGLTLLHHTVRGSWGLSVLRIFEAGGGWVSFLLCLVGFLPIWAKRAEIYAWQTAGPQKSGFRQFIFNDNMWTIRIVAYFAIWILISYILRSLSLRDDKEQNVALRRRRTSIAAPSMVVYFITGTLASTDLFMTLDQHWYSTMFGPLYIIGAALFAMSVGTLVVCANADKEPYSSIITKDLTRDLGNLTFAICMLWIYFTLSQFIIIWSGNLPELSVFYKNRTSEFLSKLGFVNVFFGWFVPWMLLLSPRVKAKPKSLMMVAALLLITRLADLAYNFLPFFRETPNWTDITAVLGCAGLWMAAFGNQITKGSLVPEHDNRLQELFAHGH